MKMTRNYWIGTDLEELEAIERELEASGALRQQIHVLTLDDTSAENHHQIHDVQSLMKKDLIRSGLFGLALGLCMGLLVLLTAQFAGWAESPAGWLPFVFLAVILVGFFTWEGGLWGIQTLNSKFRRFEQTLEAGKHVFFVDLRPDQESMVADLMRRHPSAEFAGTGAASPHWLIVWQYRMRHLFTETLP
ncbi:MAG: magnesium transporter [Pseudomonadales bacterium]